MHQSRLSPPGSPSSRAGRVLMRCARWRWNAVLLHGAPRMYLIRLGLFALCAALALPAYANAPFTAGDLVRLQRIADPQGSPDGRYVIFVFPRPTWRPIAAILICG